jgi:UDP-N-acetylmuramoyl-tripeptide--D-alanyl-D-alanine ligase
MSKTNQIIEKLYEHFVQYPDISTDSRTVKPYSIFFALRGKNFNGNEFAEQALSRGAVYAVIDDSQYQKDERYILVDDVLKTLQELANFHRRQLNIPIIAITGSSGKTTTKELIYAVLAKKYEAYATQGNLNNYIGVPLSLLAITPFVEIAVIEMGANHQKEIAELCEIAMPTHGLITNIGPVHLEGFGGIEGVMMGKGELYEYLTQHKGQAFINSTDPKLMKLSKRLGDPIYYPQDEDDYTCSLVQANPFVVYQGRSGQIVKTQLLGKHQFHNIATALCIGDYFGVDETSANQAIKNYQPLSNRCQLINRGSNVILMDAYNANPEAMKAAIQTLQLIPASHKILILGDMKELGEESAYFHEELIKLTTRYDYQAVLLHGPHLEVARIHNPKSLHFKHKEELAVYLKQANFRNTAILIKGSRSLQMETLLDAFETSKF